MKFRHLGGVLLLAGLAVFATAGPAAAHTELQSSDPAEGATLAAAPTSVKLTFGEAVTVAKDPIQVTGPGGAKWTIGTVSLAGPVVSAPVQATGPAGAYTLSYKVISDDGDAVTGAVHFTLAAAAPASTSSAAPTSSTTSAPVTSSASPSVTPSASSGSGGGFPAWAWILIVVVVLAIVAGLVVRSRRRT